MTSAGRGIPGRSQSPSEARLVEVLDAYLAAAQEGRAPSREELLAEHPDLAADLETCLASLEFIRQVSLSPSPTAGAPTAIETGDDVEAGLGDLGDFRILREVGRGGMGVVYEAVQRSLNRRVALKVLPFAAALDPTQLRRFRTEALAAAQLHHTHIVPVFWIGNEQGVHYYAMQFIEGRTLADIVREFRRIEGKDRRDGTPGNDKAPADPAAPALASAMSREFPAPVVGEDISPSAAAPAAPAGPTPAPPSGSSTRDRAYFRNVARLGMEAVEALEHAHQEGIVHRDIKPANLMVDARGHLWITDFGLARLQTDSGLTITGDLLGTLRYMSPEQALGRRAYLDHRTDIYSLGVTLYELLTLEPAFGSRDRAELLRRIADEEPRAPRKLDGSVPRELETIVLKAMSKEPAGRYQAAQELADDLRRFLEHKPIQARRPTMPERVAKWSRRHPELLAFGFILLAVIAIGLAIGSTLLARKQVEVYRQRDRANELAGIADAQRDRAKQNARLTRRAVDEMFTQVAEKWLADQPRLEPVQREFLEKALRFYEEFSKQEDTEPAARQSVADAWRRVGEIRLKLGMLGPAEEAIRQSMAINRALADASPDDPELRYRAATPYLSLAEFLFAQGKLNEAADAYRRVEEIARTLTDGTSGATHYRKTLADARGGLGFIHFRLGRLPEAERALGDAIALEEKLVLEDPRDQRLGSNLANNLNNLFAALAQSGRLDEAKTACHRAMDLRQRLLDQSPGSKEYKNELAMSIANLGFCCYALKEFSESEALYRRVLPLRRRLTADFPRVPDYRKRLAGDLDNLATILRNTGRPVEAEPFRREAVAVLESLVHDHPALPENRAALGDCLSNLGVLLLGLGKKAEADGAFRRAMDSLEPLIAEHPEIPARFIRFLECARTRGEILLGLGRIPEAEAVFRRALDLIHRMEVRSPKNPGLADQRSRLAMAFCELLMKEHRDADARAILHRELEWIESLMRADPREALGRDLWVWAAGRLSKLLSTSTDAKVRDMDRALALANRSRDFQPQSGDLWTIIGEAYFRAGHWDEAIVALKKAEELRRPHEDVTGWYHLAMAYWRKGDREQSRQYYDKAADWMSKNPYKNEDFTRLRDEASALMGLVAPAATIGKKEDDSRRPSKP